jgi:hypothetical protein
MMIVFAIGGNWQFRIGKRVGVKQVSLPRDPKARQYNTAVSLAGLYSVVGGYFRRRRHRWILTEFQSCDSVVDLGGTLESWPSGSFPNITLVNVVAANGHPLPDWASFVQADACHVPLRGPFDLAYSNSVIEHMGTWERQREFASEISRLGRRIYCQTPNRWFPIEPHYLTAFLHWLPRPWFGYIAHRWLTLQGLTQKPSRNESLSTRHKEAVRLLSKRELRKLFPECQISVERFLGWPKSYAIWR